jgi:hypothetical protein
MDYSSLKALIADMVNRDDFTDGQLSAFVSLAEAAINRSVRHPLMEKRATATITSGEYALPSDWVETVSLQSDAGRYSLVSVAELADLRKAGAYMRAYAWGNNGIDLNPIPTIDLPIELTLTYIGSIPELSLSSPTNWLLTQAQDVYLYGSLMHTAPFLQEDARLQVWAALYASAVDDVNKSGRAARWSGSGLKVRAPR